MSLQVGKAIYNILSNDAKVIDGVGHKIYPLIADTGTTFPFIVYRRTSIDHLIVRIGLYIVKILMWKWL